MWAALGKAAVGVVKGGAKKIATDKLMNRKKKTDARRAAAQKMMGGEEGGEEKGGAIVVRPKAALVQSPAGAIEKYSGGDQQQSGGGEDLQGLVLRIKTSTIQVEKLLGNSVALQKQQIDDARKAREAAQNKKTEEDLEKKKPKAKSKGPKLNLPGKGLLGGIIDFISNIIFGWIAVRLVDLGPKLKGLLVWLGRIADWTITGVGWILNGLVTLIDWGYKFVEMGRGLVKNVFGEEGLKKFDTFLTSLKNLISGFLIWKLIGKKIFKAIVQNIRNTWNVIKGVFAKAGKFLNWMTGGRAGNLAKNVLSKGKGVVGNIGRRLGVGVKRFAGKGARSLFKGASGGLKSIFKKGLGKAARRLVIKFFGKTAGKIFGKIPIIGPVIVGIISMMSGEPLGQALFKTLGAAVGGLLGTFIPIPVVGTLLGEAVGVFVGDLLYHLIVKRDPKAAFKMLKDTVMGIFKGGKAIVDWLFGGGLFKLLSKGGGLLLKFGKWLFLTAIPWASKKITGLGKIIGEWLGAGVERWKSSFPMFKIPNVGIQDMIYKIFDIRWPDFWPFSGRLSLGIGGEPVLPFLEGWRPDFLENLPRLPRILGFLWQNVPGLSALVDSAGEVTGFPKFWLLGNPLFMMSHTKNAFFPGRGSGNASLPSDSGSSSGSSGSSGSIGKPIDPNEKKQDELKVSEEQKGKDEINESISRKADYEEVDPVVVTVPVIVKPGGSLPQGSNDLVSVGGGNESGNDPYEVLDFQG